MLYFRSTVSTSRGTKSQLNKNVKHQGFDDYVVNTFRTVGSMNSAAAKKPLNELHKEVEIQLFDHPF